MSRSTIENLMELVGWIGYQVHEGDELPVWPQQLVHPRRPRWPQRRVEGAEESEELSRGHKQVKLPVGNYC
jgi:hypothetical protein